MSEWPAERLTELAIEWMRARRPDALIIPEFVCGSMGASRIDIAAIARDGIFGIEVKGDGDTPSRLRSQGTGFSAVCSTVHLLASPNLKTLWNHKPPHWGWLSIDGERISQDDWSEPHKDYMLAPQSLLDTLWRPELLKLCTKLSVGVDRKRITVGKMIAEIAELVPLREIRASVCEALLERDWKGWTPGKPRRVFWPEGREPAPSPTQAQDDMLLALRA